jgi:hypothetical protein
MPAILNAPTRSARLTVVRDALDAGPGPAVLVIGTTGMATTLATFTLTDPSGTVSGDVLTLTPASSGEAVAAATGTAAAAELRTSAGTVIVSGLAVGAQVTIDNPSIVSGQTVTLVGATLSHFNGS